MPKFQNSLDLCKNRRIVSPRLLRAVPLAFLGIALIAQSAFAQAAYNFQVEEFAVPERGIFDTFGDGSILSNPGWTSLRGTISESGGSAILESPGEGGLLAPLPLLSQSTSLSGQGVQLNGGGNLTATSTWTGIAPALGTSYSLAIGSLNSATGNVHQISIGIANAEPGSAAVFGAAPGYNVNVIQQIRQGSAGSGPVLSTSAISQAYLPGSIGAQVLLNLVFDDATNTITPTYSLDGVTTQSFGAVSWDFFGGGFSLTGSSVTAIPEPGSALLIGLGLAGLTRRSRRSA